MNPEDQLPAQQKIPEEDESMGDRSGSSLQLLGTVAREGLSPGRAADNMSITLEPAIIPGLDEEGPSSLPRGQKRKGPDVPFEDAVSTSRPRLNSLSHSVNEGLVATLKPLVAK